MANCSSLPVPSCKIYTALIFNSGIIIHYSITTWLPAAKNKLKYSPCPWIISTVQRPLREDVLQFVEYLFKSKIIIGHSQLLSIILLKFNSPVLLNLLGNIFPYCPAVGAIRRINSSNIDLQEGQCWSCNWECLYCDSSRDIRWNIAWALGKSLGLCPWDFPWAQDIFHCISLLSSQYRFSKQP